MENSEHNFAGQLTQRLGEHSYLMDAATGETIPPAHFRQAIPSFGASLLAQGLRAGDRILLGCALSPASSIAYLGAMYAGLVPVPLEESVLLSSLTKVVKGTGARAVWMENISRLEAIAEPGVLALGGHPGERPSDTMPAAPRALNDLAVLVATSGSTGAPRFVMISHGNLAANTEAITRSQHLQDDERAMLILPLSYCFGASVLHTHLYRGGGVVFDRRFMFPDKVLHAIGQYQCTTFAGVPTVYNILLRRSNFRSIGAPTLRRFLQAGGPLAPQSVMELHSLVPTAKFYVMYGQTEATARISCLDSAQLHRKLGSVGRPLDNLSVRIVDEGGRDLLPDQTGEIGVKGPSISLGYYNEPEETERIFSDGWLRTGDLGHLDAEGYLWIDGRQSNFLKTRGMRVSFAEVEAKVGAVPGVYECAATTAPHPEVGEALVLYIVPDGPPDEVIERVRRSLPTCWTCDSINVVTEIPKTVNGKVSRLSLAGNTVETHG